MTPQEEQLLNSLVERVNQTQLQEKDPDAEGLLNQALGKNPDALYILAQTVLVQNIALDQAKAQVAQLQQQVAQAQQQAQQQPQPARATSFLGGLLGHRDPAPAQPGYTPVPQVQPGYGQGYPPAGPPQYVPAGQPQFVPAGGGQPSFLRGAMQTAAGVAAGALAFEGVESVLHGIGGMGHSGFGWGGIGGGMMGGGFERPVEETVINNYYDQPGERGGMERGGGEFAGGDHPWHDSGSQVADQGGAQFENASYNTGGDAQANDDQGVYDNGNVDDGSGFDDGGGGGFDDGGGGFGGDDGGGGFV